MNLSEILRKIPEDKLYKNPKTKEKLSKSKEDIIEKLSDMLEHKRKESSIKNQKKFL